MVDQVQMVHQPATELLATAALVTLAVAQPMLAMVRMERSLTWRQRQQQTRPNQLI
ncbi:hypothetical protein FC99_GL000920 [Levilactobacillus koreensis JCM 16448]|nr:hypothetical protein FC99_GL000920 [Levilactobacillus koreensis JCM 16448]